MFVIEIYDFLNFFKLFSRKTEKNANYNNREINKYTRCDDMQKRTDYSTKPSLFDFSKIAFERRLLDDTEVEQYRRNKAGISGENKVATFIREIGRPNWTLLENVWLANDGLFECDLILITDYAIHTFEVKHYTGRFTYENGHCKIGNIKMEQDCIQQARKSFLKLHNICRQFDHNLTVNGALVFSSSKNKVSIQSPVEDIKILEMPDLYEYLENIKRAENSIPAQPINPQVIIDFLKSYNAENPYLQNPISTDNMKIARKGVCCSMCRSFDVAHSKHYVQCSCGFHESREEAIVRTACEYGVLTYDRNFSTGDIYQFIDGQASAVYLRKVLSRHFKYSFKNKHSYYKNIGVLYSDISHQFSFVRNSYHIDFQKLFNEQNQIRIL